MNNEQRLAAYLKLIKSLLDCPNGEEPEILQANMELLDLGFVQTTMQVANTLAARGDDNRANFLRNLATQLTEELGINSRQITLEEYFKFLGEVLQAVLDSKGNPQVIYPILAANQDKLDENLGKILRNWATARFQEVESAQAPYIAAVIAIFSDLIKEFPLGRQAINLEIAITGYETALEVYTRPAFPEEWADTQNNLANAYDSRIKGDRSENIELAIAFYQNALEVRTRSAFPQDWASTQNNLAIAYKDRIKGDRGDNIELAIASFQQALEVYTRTAFPEQWAMTQNNLAIAYRNQIKGDRGDNIELAIKSYQLALEVRTRNAFPQYWAMTQNNLANAYSDRIKGDRGDNIELAIKSYQLALEVRTRNAFPKQWAMTQNNLAAAYRNRIKGGRGDNIELAIASFQQALEVYTRSAFPEQWAMTQNNLAAAYSDRILGDRAENLEKAIKSYQNALEIYTPQALPINCLGTGKNLGDLGFKEGRWNIAIEGYAVAIDAVEISRSWATNETRRAEIHQQSIDIYTNIVQAYINLNQYDKAIEYVERSRSKVLTDLMASKDLYGNAEIPPEVEAYLKDYNDIQRQINENLFPPDASSGRELATTRDRANFEAYNETIRELEAQKQEIWLKLRQLDPVLAGQIKVAAPNFAAMQQLLKGEKKTAIVCFYSTQTDTHIFVLRSGKIDLHTCKGEGIDTLQKWILENWLIPYIADKKNWQEQMQMQRFFTQLAPRLQLSKLIENYLQDIEELIIIPHLYLHQIPFAALPIAEGKYHRVPLLGDKFRLRYVPSCQVLEFCHNRVNGVEKQHLDIETGYIASLQKYGTIEDATEDLPFASFEGEKVAQMYDIPDTFRLKGRTQANVKNYRQLLHQINVAHSSHHATSRMDNQLESMLVLADGGITLGELLMLRLPELSEVFLSCCETGLGLVQNLTDDIITLGTGFLCAGANSVVSTLWTVDDLATSLFSIFYYQERQKGKNRSTALQSAQSMLKNLSGGTLKNDYSLELKSHLDRQLDKATNLSNEAVKRRDLEVTNTEAYQQWDKEYKHYEKLRKNIYKMQKGIENYCEQDQPFESPFFWAAFTCQGLTGNGE